MNDKALQRAELLRIYKPSVKHRLEWICGQLKIDQRQAVVWLRAEGHDV